MVLRGGGGPVCCERMISRESKSDKEERGKGLVNVSFDKEG
jgi:hypothetical protein